MKKITFLTILFAVTFSYSQNSGDIIISEIMKNPKSVSDSNGEWLELYNTTNAIINIKNWIIADLSSSHTIASTLNIPANGYVTLCKKNDYGINGGVNCDYQYNSVTLNNGSETITLSNGETLIDAVMYDATFPSIAGESMQLNSTSLNTLDNDNASNWCTSTTTYGAGDMGTPGTANISCETMSTKTYNKVNFTVYPNPAKCEITVKTESQSPTKISIYSVMGQEIMNTTTTNKSLDIATLNTGTYLVRITQKGTSLTKKLIVE